MVKKEKSDTKKELQEFGRDIVKQINKGKNPEIITGDALTILPSLILNTNFLLPNRYAIVGNIPYYITGMLLRTIGELEHKPRFTVLMIQKEVAVRVCAGPGQMNLLAAAVQFWGQPKILFTLKENDFDPPPKVKSAVITITPQLPGPTAAPAYYRFIKAAFKQPRKLLINNLIEGYALSKQAAIEILKNESITAGARGQDLSVKQIDALSKRLARLEL